MVDHRIYVLAGALAVSNYGHGVNRERVFDLVTAEPRRRVSSSRSAVEDLAGHLIESREHEEMFASEAKGWELDIRAMGLDHYVKTYGRYNDWLWMFEG